MADESWKFPTLVQELAATLEEPPSRYVLREKDRPSSLLVTDDMPEPLPVINLSRLSEDTAEAAKLESALQSWGLVLPLEEKQKYSNLIDGKHFQVEGYGNDRVATEHQILNWNDRLRLKVAPEDERNYTHWPEHPESFRDVLHEYELKTKKIRDDIFRAMAKILDLDEDYFINLISDRAAAFARFNYFPPCPWPDLINGAQPHSDASILTILLVDKEICGLQVQRDGIWYNVPSKPYALLINLGDVMEIMSNGIFKSPVHRVVTNTEKERISMAVFYGVGADNVLEPVASLLDEKRPARYRKVEMTDFIAGVSEQLYRGTRFIESLKI